MIWVSTLSFLQIQPAPFVATPVARWARAQIPPSTTSTKRRAQMILRTTAWRMCWPASIPQSACTGTWTKLPRWWPTWWSLWTPSSKMASAMAKRMAAVIWIALWSGDPGLSRPKLWTGSGLCLHSQLQNLVSPSNTMNWHNVNCIILTEHLSIPARL